MKDLPGEPKQLFDQKALTDQIASEIRRRALTMYEVSREICIDRSHFYQALYGRPIFSVELYLRLVQWLETSRTMPAASEEEVNRAHFKRRDRTLSVKGAGIYTRLPGDD